MEINHKRWIAQVDRMPGSQEFRVYGMIEVAHAGVTPVLNKPAQDASPNVTLSLTLEDTGEILPHVKAYKNVIYREPGTPTVSSVEIFYNDALLHRIDGITRTS